MQHRYAFPLRWSPLFREIAQWSEQFVNHQVVSEQTEKDETRHIAVKQIEATTWPAEFVLPLKVERVFLMGVRGGEITSVHADGWERLAALNLPVGPAGGSMQWFDQGFKEVRKLFKSEHGTPKPVRWVEGETHDAEMVPDYELLLEEPTVVDVNSWHRVFNLHNANTRYALTIRFVGNPSYKSIVEAFSGVRL
jgi:hypothetical protein